MQCEIDFVGRYVALIDEDGAVLIVSWDSMEFENKAELFDSLLKTVGDLGGRFVPVSGD